MKSREFIEQTFPLHSHQNHSFHLAEIILRIREEKKEKLFKSEKEELIICFLDLKARTKFHSLFDENYCSVKKALKEVNWIQARGHERLAMPFNHAWKNPSNG